MMLKNLHKIFKHRGIRGEQHKSLIYLLPLLLHILQQSEITHMGSSRKKFYLLVFYHNILGGYFTKYSDEASYIDETYKYSILSNISDLYRDSDKKFTFALVYDELQIYNIWQQTNNPLNEEAQWPGYHYNVTGYNPIRILAGKVNDYCTWGGLLIQHTLMDVLGAHHGFIQLATQEHIGNTQDTFLLTLNL